MTTQHNAETTKNRLADALTALMLEKPLHKISIRQLTDRCGVNRQTFYYHFDDIYDLLRWYYRREVADLLARQEKAENWQKRLLLLFEYLEENRSLSLATLNSLGHDDLRRFFYDDLYNILCRVTDTLSDEIHAPEETRHLITHFYLAALMSLTESWLKGQLNIAPEELVQATALIFEDHLRGAKVRAEMEK